jgi:hypothetical protein
MTTAELLVLARTAIEDQDARLVLADAIEETGWWDDRLHYEFSNGDDRADCLSLLTWPGDMGARHARVIAEALASPPSSEEKT